MTVWLGRRAEPQGDDRRARSLRRGTAADCYRVGWAPKGGLGAERSRKAAIGGPVARMAVIATCFYSMVYGDSV